ncbi:MAG: hypothetical protein U0R19_18825 [Bryobacteraceae bacterium]
MNTYPDSVSKVVSDYTERLKLHLQNVPPREQDEFLKEIQSHIYEAYQESPIPDDLTRILTVLRKLGEPADVVSDRLSATMVRSGAARNLPLRILAGIFIALLGIPLGFGGVAVLTGILAALAAVLVSYYAVSAALLLTGSVVFLFGALRTYRPELWDRLIDAGILRFHDRPGRFFDQLPAAEQSFLMLFLAALFLAAGVAMLWFGKHLVRGLRTVSAFAFDGIRRLARRARHTITGQRQRHPAIFSWPSPSSSR